MVMLKLLTSKPALFALGAASAAAWKLFGPAVGRTVRPVVKDVIKGGLVLQKQISTAAQETWQDIEDITAEAKAEIAEREKDGDEAEPRQRKPRSRKTAS
ncbi:MAG: DUF5132 domain-containing protein [Deltaproteobacteria bacterium]|nr:DUF5132 domain-containing protein [Deltaproteobacteria bacterium]MBM4299752.1 DUF5132 domain-containing protein [Deltaproteobacteria bacterium]